MPGDTKLKSAKIVAKTEFMLVPTETARETLTQRLDLRALKKLRFSGSIEPEAASDLLLIGTLGATVVQDCVVTGAPVTTRIDETVTRRFLADMPEPDGDEAEMPDDDTLEPLATEIDLALVMEEALALALPDWPRADGVETVDLTVTEPGAAPMTQDDARPFAGLKALKDQMSKDDT